MTYHELLKTFRLLSNNPNIGKLSNESKIKFLKMFSVFKNEINVLIEAEKTVYEKYDLKQDESGVIKMDNLDDEQRNEFVNEFNGLHESIADINYKRLTESEFNIITEDKTINKADGTKIDFCYNADELVFLFNQITSDDTQT